MTDAPYNAYPYRDPQDKEPERYCDECGEELYEYDKEYHFHEKILCESCFIYHAVQYIKDFPEQMEQLIEGG